MSVNRRDRRSLLRRTIHPIQDCVSSTQDVVSSIQGRTDPSYAREFVEEQDPATQLCRPKESSEEILHEETTLGNPPLLDCLSAFRTGSSNSPPESLIPAPADSVQQNSTSDSTDDDADSFVLLREEKDSEECAEKDSEKCTEKDSDLSEEKSVVFDRAHIKRLSVDSLLVNDDCSCRNSVSVGGTLWATRAQIAHLECISSRLPSITPMDITSEMTDTERELCKRFNNLLDVFGIFHSGYTE
jgi:hypothetical protein